MKTGSFFFRTRIARIASNLRGKSVRIGCGKLAIARYRYRRSSGGQVEHERDERVVCGWYGGGRFLFSKAELDVRPPPTRRDHLAGDQCSGADKSHERARLGPSAGRSSKGPHDEGGAFRRRLSSFRACLSFLLHVPSTIATAGTGSSSRDPGANRSVLLCVKAKIKKKEQGWPPFRFGPSRWRRS